MDEKLAEVLKLKENKQCFDCGAAMPKWASINNSVFVCLNCAGLHRGVGVNYTFIRSLTMDNWDDSQIKMLSIGGNERLRLFLEEFGIPVKLKIDTKYKLKALDYYRKLLRAEAFNEPMPVKPDMVSAFEVTEQEQMEKPKEQLSDGKILNFPLQDNPNTIKTEDESNDFFGKIGHFFQSSANDIQKGFQDLKIKEKANNFEQKAIAFKNKTFTSIGETTNVAVTSVSSFFKKTIKFFDPKGKDKAEESSEENPSSKSMINPVSNMKIESKGSNIKADPNVNINLKYDDVNIESYTNMPVAKPKDEEDPNSPPQI